MKNENIGFYAAAVFLTGAAVGAVTGILLAPETGAESRRKLSQWLSDRREKGRAELLARKEQAAAVIEAGRNAYVRSAEKPVAA